MPLALLALAIGAFGIGTTEFGIMGLLPEVAGDFGVSIPTAGLLVTGYALGVVAYEALTGHKPYQEAGSVTSLAEALMREHSNSAKESINLTALPSALREFSQQRMGITCEVFSEPSGYSIVGPGTGQRGA